MRDDDALDFIDDMDPVLNDPEGIREEPLVVVRRIATAHDWRLPLITLFRKQGRT
jgi:hypothetical protein